MQRERISSFDAAMLMLRDTAATLTSLNLDWILNVPSSQSHGDASSAAIAWADWYLGLFCCRFPHLRALQLRNSVVADTLLPKDLYLLDRSRSMSGTNTKLNKALLGATSKDSLDLAGLQFMEAHPNLQCLGWPMDRFLSPTPTDAQYAERVEAVVENLGRTLVDLRVDTLYNGSGEPNSEDKDWLWLDSSGNLSLRSCTKHH